MKLITLANNNVFEAHDDAAKELIATGLYKPYEEPKKEEKRSPVAPMTTADMPTKKRKGKTQK